MTNRAWLKRLSMVLAVAATVATWLFIYESIGRF